MASQPEEIIEPYKLNELFSLFHEFDGNTIVLKKIISKHSFD